MQWLAIILVVIVIAMLVWLFDYAREYDAILKGRNPLNDEELARQFFDRAEVSPDIPGKVREIIARHMEYPAEKMLPDDDLSFYWNEIDGADLVHDLESHFGIVILDQDAELATCTIRSISNLVSRLRQRVES